jgi:hypothetical protein
MTDMSPDTTADSDQARYTMTEAAARLGISREALRLRIRRGRVLASKSGGQWHIYLPADTPVNGADTPSDTTAHTSTDSDRAELVAALREELEHARGEIARLWSALGVRDRELERKDAIILALAQRPALPAGSIEPQPTTEARTESPQEPPSAPKRRGWLDRLLGR